MGRIVGREANGHAITGDHANPKAAHASRELSRYLLAVLERNLITTSAEDFVHAASRLNEIVTRQFR